MNKREFIYKDLKKKILELKIKGHDILKEEDIAAKYKVSRTPAREALHLLEKDGFLQKVRKVGYILKPLTKNDLNEIIGLRSILESYAAFLTTKNLKSSIIKKLKKLNDKAYESILKKDLEKFFKINSEFHKTIYQSSGNKRLSQLIENLMENFARYRLMLLKINKMPETSYTDHLEMIKAMEEKNPEKVEKLVKEHIEKGGKELQKYLENGDLGIII